MFPNSNGPLRGLFSDIGSHSSGGNRNYFHPGNYLAKILSCKWKPDGFKGKSYIAEFEITEVLLKRDAETRKNQNGKDVHFEPSRRVGDTVSAVFKLDGPNAVLAKGNLADFIRACGATAQAEQGQIVSIKDVEIGEEDVEASYADDQPLVGMELEVHCQGTITVAKQEAFTQVQYVVPRKLIDKAQSAA